jgi:hypothetical protein
MSLPFLKVVPKRDKVFVELCNPDIHTSMPRLSQVIYPFDYPFEALSQGIFTSQGFEKANADESTGVAGRSLCSQSQARVSHSARIGRFAS